MALRNKGLFDIKTYFLYKAWKTLIIAYLTASALSLLAGYVLINFFNLEPAIIQGISSKRISYAFPVIDQGLKLGLDLGVLLFIWNSLAALATMSFVYTAQFFNPENVSLFPQAVRKVFCGKSKMRVLCLLPGCLEIKVESHRRLYVWLMIPLLGMILLGLETGLSVSTSTFTFGSMMVGILSFLPHGIIEIPSIALAGAVAFSAQLRLKETIRTHSTGDVFDLTRAYASSMPVSQIASIVIASLFVAGLVEAHVTRNILNHLLN